MLHPPVLDCLSSPLITYFPLILSFFSLSLYAFSSLRGGLTAMFMPNDALLRGKKFDSWHCLLALSYSCKHSRDGWNTTKDATVSLLKCLVWLDYKYRDQLGSIAKGPNVDHCYSMIIEDLVTHCIHHSPHNSVVTGSVKEKQHLRSWLSYFQVFCPPLFISLYTLIKYLFPITRSLSSPARKMPHLHIFFDSISESLTAFRCISLFAMCLGRFICRSIFIYMFTIFPFQRMPLNSNPFVLISLWLSSSACFLSRSNETTYGSYRVLPPLSNRLSVAN